MADKIELTEEELFGLDLLIGEKYQGLSFVNWKKIINYTQTISPIVTVTIGRLSNQVSDKSNLDELAKIADTMSLEDLVDLRKNAIIKS